MNGPAADGQRTAVLTIVAGRHDHLRGQLLGLARSQPPPQWHVVAAMGDPAVRDVLDSVPAPAGTRRVVLDVPVAEDGELPLAAARNAAAGTATALGADLLVLLDVDCVPAAGLVAAYRDAADRVRAHPGPRLLCGPVAYLPPDVRVHGPGDLDRLPAAADPHPARPAPAAGEVVRAQESQWWLFWSLSFAVSAADWAEFGGFCEEFRGYGGEDTDVAATVRDLGGSLFWVGGAAAFHQHHPTRNPPVQHLAAILRNGAVFHRRWGWWPMTGWLEQFREAGLVDYDAATRSWTALTAPTPRPGAPGTPATAARSTAS
ncbi:glycosyltransferase family 2 protein [Kineococcus sp. TBRC 1896]|uniref:Glycosyltransferase family 2 protein n=1 Tax=Kineococcus mangrovi TaxID=1660183 RepID=A0ABV4HZE8_9ACTN